MDFIFSKTTFAINELQECVETLLKRVSMKSVAEEVNHLYTLIHLAEIDKDAADKYTEAVKSVSGDAFREDVFANEHHRRIHAKANDSIIFAAKEICMHNSLVYHKTGKYILSRRYDISNIKDCEKCIEEFKLYATFVAAECYIAKK